MLDCAKQENFSLPDPNRLDNLREHEHNRGMTALIAPDGTISAQLPPFVQGALSTPPCKAIVEQPLCVLG
jgi:hypothetical protein